MPTSSSTASVRARGLSKRYLLGRSAAYGTLRDSLAGWLRASGRAGGEELWALRDVSFDVDPGEVIGIIGRNGAGKSTLLKILARITEPTAGSAELTGRVGSLLEVGTGFHPELTGRENTFLNGALLGMPRSEIARRFDEIVAFADVERFLDTPVKHYSSGMYTRLAFAVAAHLEPEILIVDEVLAVGDAAFQRKCLGRMSEVAGEGRTVLFVSHNMAAVRALCSRSIVMREGRVAFDGPSEQAIDHYLEAQRAVSLTPLAARADRRGDGRVRFTAASVEDDEGNRVEYVRSGQRVHLVAEYVTPDGEPPRNLSVAFALNGRMGEQLTDLWSEGAGDIWEVAPASGRVTCTLPRLPLNAGHYTFNVIARVGGTIADWINDACRFTVEGGDFFGSGRLPDQRQGSVLFDQRWGLEELCAASPASGS